MLGQPHPPLDKCQHCLLLARISEFGSEVKTLSRFLLAVFGGCKARIHWGTPLRVATFLE